MRHLAITGIETASWISRIIPGSDMRATPPWARMSAGTRSSAITDTAPASSATRACSASTTSMITPPLSISARPLLTRIVPVSCSMARILAGGGPRLLVVLVFGLTAERVVGVQLGDVVDLVLVALDVVDLVLLLVVPVVVLVELRLLEHDREHVRLAGGEVQPLAVIE